MSFTRNLKRFYVYIHYRATDLTPFYIGKGSGNRIDCSSSRTEFWKTTASKYGIVKKKVINNLTEEQAFKLEVRLIGLYKSRNHKLVNFTEGGEGVSGLVHTDEARKKMSEAKKGKSLPAPPGRGVAISKAKRGKPTKTTKAVYCITDDKEFVSIGDAARFYGINPGNLSKLLHKRASYLTLAGREFRWLD